MKELGQFLGGIALFVIGLYLLLININVTSFGFYSYRSVNSAPMLIILFIIFVVLAVLHSKWYTWFLVILDIVLMIISVILGTRLTFKHISAFELIAMLMLFAIGAGLILKSLIGVNKKDK